MTPADHGSLTPCQQAALAKVACGCGRPGGVTVLCGPRGVGKSLVLAAVAAAITRSGRTAAAGSIAEWLDTLAGGAAAPDVALVDDAHLAAGSDLTTLLDRCRRTSAVVLAGQGRLLTLVARNSRIEEAISLRAVLRACTHEESATIIPRIAREARFDDSATTAIHEIAAGIPAAMRRLVELADVVAATRENGVVTAADVEAIHRRLSPLAA